MNSVFGEDEGMLGELSLSGRAPALKHLSIPPTGDHSRSRRRMVSLLLEMDGMFAESSALQLALLDYDQ